MLNGRIDDLRNEELVKVNARECVMIKDHNVYMVDIETYGGLCAIAFYDGYLIYSRVKVNHSNCKTDEELRETYIKVMNNTLYTEDELSYVKDYDDYTVKNYFIRNYYCNRKDHLSWFYSEITKDKYEILSSWIKDRDKIYEKLNREIYTENNNVCFCFFKSEDKEFSDHIYELLKGLEKAKDESENNPDYMVSAFYYEMCNHEYCINWQADWDVCSCFDRCKYGEDKGYVEYLTEMGHPEWIPLYIKARKKYYKAAEENDWG